MLTCAREGSQASRGWVNADHFPFVVFHFSFLSYGFAPGCTVFAGRAGRGSARYWSDDQM